MFRLVLTKLLLFSVAERLDAGITSSFIEEKPKVKIEEKSKPKITKLEDPGDKLNRVNNTENGNCYWLVLLTFTSDRRKIH